MNFLFINKFFFLNGGSERVFFQERDFLLEKGFRIVDFSMEDSRNLASDFSNYFVKNIDFNSPNKMFSKPKQGFQFVHSTESIKKLKSLLLKKTPDIAHLHNIYHQLTPSIIPLLKKYGAKTVLTLHDYKLICPNYLMQNGNKICDACSGKYFWMPIYKNCQNSKLQSLLLSIEAYWHKWKGSYDSVDLFIAPSRFMAQQIAKRIPEEKIKVLRNGIDLQSMASNGQDHGYALYLGRLSHEKGVETLLEAHQRVSDSVRLKVIGTGPEENRLKDAYGQAEFLGYKQGPELHNLITDAAFVVVPSQWYENCSMVVLEAMAAGKPVIGSNIGGIPEQVEDGRTGLLFEMGNVEALAEKMNILATNPEMRSRFGKAARRKVELEYSLDGHCNGLLDIYRKLLEEN